MSQKRAKPGAGYYQKAFEYAAALPKDKGSLSIIQIYHDDWCPKLKGDQFPCTCNPDVKPELFIREEEKYIWGNRRLARSEVTAFHGEEGIGKSTLIDNIAAKLTLGKPMPGDKTALQPPSGVVYITPEGTEAEERQARLAQFEADFTKIIQLHDAEDADAIRAAVRKIDAKLLIVDPLEAFSLVKPKYALSDLAKELGIAAVVLTTRPVPDNLRGKTKEMRI